MKPGKRPEPTVLRVLKGNPSNRPLNKREPKPNPDMPECPSWLSRVAKAKWRQVAPELRKMGVLSFIDGDALANYCQTWARWREAEEYLQKHGSIFPMRDADGTLKYMIQMPYVAIARTLLLILNRIQQEFGLTPSSRSRINAAPVEEESTGPDIERYFRVSG
jgi:P27 family predicted phage terminase small subunit